MSTPQADDASSGSLYIARQPIYNHNLGVFAYELLFRSRASLSWRPSEADAATSQVVLSTFAEIGLDALVGSRRAAINMTPRVLAQMESMGIPAERIILDLPPDMKATDENRELLRRLAAKGYLLAMDDYAGTQEQNALLPRVHMVKIPVLGRELAEVHRLARMAGEGKRLLVAEQVESLEQYESLRDGGFRYFQGYFLSRPRVYRTQSLPARKLSVLRLLARLQDPDADPGDLARVINEDVGLSYKLLRLLNSPLFGLSRKLDSVKQAVILLGNKQLSNWVCMLAMAGMEDRPRGLMHLALRRARLCERLAELASLRPSQSYFTAGMFSVLDLLMERPLDQLLPPLPLDDSIKQAILQGEGPMAAAIACSKAGETDEEQAIVFNGLAREDIRAADVEATRWADEIMGSMGLGDTLEPQVPKLAAE